MNCPMCGGDKIAAEKGFQDQWSIYCLTPIKSMARKYCLYHFNKEERRLFKKWAQDNGIGLKDLRPKNAAEPRKTGGRKYSDEVKDAARKEYLRLYITTDLSAGEICEAIEEKYGIAAKCVPAILPNLAVSPLPNPPNHKYVNKKAEKAKLIKL